MTLANFHYGQGGSTNEDRRRGIKGASHDKLSGNVSLSCCWEDLFHIYYSRHSVSDISDFSPPRIANPLPIFSPLRISASPDALFPLPPLSPLLMWQNKLRPIRIKALKRSLKPLKVFLNWGMTIWAVWQQMLNGVIASPPQQGLLSRSTHARKPSHRHVNPFTHAHTHKQTICSIHPLPEALQLSFTVHILCSQMQI